MIRWVAPSVETAEALMPSPCPHIDCEGVGDAHCWGCRGTGETPPALTWLVVEGGYHWIAGHPLLPPTEFVRAVESGERIEIAAWCRAEHTVRHHIAADGTVVPTAWCPGLVVVGTVVATAVLPIVQESPNGPRRDAISIGLDYSAWHFNRPVDLSVYGPAESLPGRYAVSCTDARRDG